METWKTDNYKLPINLEFSNFKEVVEFISPLTVEVEVRNHHPNICLYNYCYL
ncbi:MAG: 4a-hydroxytetrahydrobiopterin dehydratase [Marinilabiliaceae bacterium]|nr:4a-hydroxytetrahydrobiopterin dehydratase [Marinilabiliaceae bacterium]